MKKENKLKEAAQILKEEIEASGAWGGNEFAVSYLHDAYDALKNAAEDCGLELSETDMRRDKALAELRAFEGGDTDRLESLENADRAYAFACYSLCRGLLGQLPYQPM